MNIRILNMRLLNFKGVRNYSITFKDVTNIFGDNGTGKSTLNDAFTWLLFDKDSNDKKDFGIKTLTLEGQPIRKLEHEVSGTLDVDGVHVLLRKCYREKWVKTKGQQHEEFKGHETDYYYNDVPLSKKDYETKIATLLNENLAKLLTNPLHFNQTLKWQERREVLNLLAGDIQNEHVFDKIVTVENKGSFIGLINALNQRKTVKEYRDEIRKKKQLINDELVTIPTRIEELNRAMPTPVDVEAINNQIALKRKEIESIELAMEDKSTQLNASYQKIQEAQQNKLRLENELRAMINGAGENKRIKIQEVDNQLRSLGLDESTFTKDLARYENMISENKSHIESFNTQKKKLLEDWNAKNAEEFLMPANSTACPTCKREFEANKKQEITEELQANFNKQKSKDLESINERGVTIKSHVVSLENTNSEYEHEIKKLTQKLTETQAAIEAKKIEKEEILSVPDAEPLEAAELREKINAVEIPEAPKIDNTELRISKNNIASEIEALSIQISSNGQIEKLNVRINELSEMEKTLAQQLADYEQIEFSIDQFTKAKIDSIEQRINGKFKLVTFRMFETQVNGGYSECCECLINGVPFYDANSASKINAGIDIINALSEYYNISAPVWIDNRESTNQILPCASQIINLIVTYDKELRIS